MNKRKILINGAVIAGIIAITGFMAIIKHGRTDDSSGTLSRSAPTVTADTEPAKPSLPDEALNLTTPFDLAEYRSAGVPVIIDFGADSCIPCRQMAPVLVELHRELQGKAIIRFVDVWKYRDLANGIPLQVIPTQVFFDASGKPFTPSEKLQIPMNQYMIRDANEHVFTTHEGGLTKDQLLAILYKMGMEK